MTVGNENKNVVTSQVDISSALNQTIVTLQASTTFYELPATGTYLYYGKNCSIYILSTVELKLDSETGLYQTTSATIHYKDNFMSVNVPVDVQHNCSYSSEYIPSEYSVYPNNISLLPLCIV